jgi:parallel beta-helix repeat protein
MRVISKEKITLCLLIGLFVFAIGNPLMTTGVLQEETLEKHDKVAPAYTPHDAILLDGNAEMIAQATTESWPGDGSSGDPYQITGYSFYDVQHSVEIRNIDLHWTFTDNEIDGPGDATVWCGMEISNSANGYVANNVIFNRFRGLWLIDINDVTITNNIVEDNLFHGIECVGYINGCLISDNIVRRNDGSGIRILSGVNSEISENSVTDCDGTGIQIIGTATNCQITDNYVNEVTSLGIQLKDATSVEVMHNVLSNVTGDGIYFLGSTDCEVYNNSLMNGGDDGMVLKESDSGLFHNNTFIGIDGVGISVDSGENSIIRFNHIEDCTDYGLKTSDEAEFTEITRNVFINNGATKQVCDEGENNTYIYNYYDDWTSPDVDSDQIVDTPYSIDGVAGNQDLYPLADPYPVPPVTTTTNTTTSTGTGTPTPMELLLLAGGGVIVILVVVFFVKRKV